MEETRDQVANRRLGRIWDTLVKHAGAHEDGRDGFLACAAEYGRERKLEYRFCGSLGFGGKVWLNNGPYPYVNFYKEDETPERRETVRVTDVALKSLELTGSSKGQPVVIGESCFICGNEWTLYTTAEQPAGEPDGAYSGHDGDSVECLECGAIAWLSVDGEEGTAYVNYEETSDHNLECARKYEAKEKEASRKKS